jgi:acetyltransferase-like isoleucine patch superfamily enzyme
MNTMASALLIKLAIGRPDQRSCELWSPAYFRWLFLHNLFRSLDIPLGVLRGTTILNAFYRLAGAKIGKGVRLHTLTLHDLDLVTVADATIVGRDANIQPAVIHCGRLVRQAVHIGRNCIIGANASVLGGAHIADGTNVSALSVVASPLNAQANRDNNRSSGEGSTRSPSTLQQAAGYIVVAYITSLAIALGITFLRAAAEHFGARFPSISGIALGLSEPAPVSLVFFAAVALAVYVIIPVGYFALVVGCKRLFLQRATKRSPADNTDERQRWSHWLYATLIDVPFFRMYLRLTVGSHLTKWNFQLLGARIGARPFLAAPYTAEPEPLEMADHAMLAGNVSLFGVDAAKGLLGKIRLGNSAIVANSCVLQGGANLADFSLLGDLSTADRADVVPPHAIALGVPPRVVGRTNFHEDNISKGNISATNWC